MRIQQDLDLGTICLTQKPYWEHVLNRFSFDHITPRNTPQPVGLILDSNMSPKTDSEREQIHDKPYRLVVGSVMWGHLATRLDLAFTVSLLHSSFPIQSRYQPLECSDACYRLHQKHDLIWSYLFTRFRSISFRFCGRRLWRMSGHPKVHIWICFPDGWRTSRLEQQMPSNSSSLYSQGRVCSYVTKHTTISLDAQLVR